MRLIMSALRVCVPSAPYSFWGSKKFLFLVIWSRGLHFRRESKVNSRSSGRCVLCRWVLSQQREMRISWRLCNSSENHFCWWNVWSLVVSSQSSFYLTRARKDDKNRQNTFFSLPKMMALLPDKQRFIMAPSRSNYPAILVTRNKKRLKRVQIWKKNVSIS